MVPRTIRKVFYSLLGATGVVFALSAFYLLSRTAQNASDFDELQNQILLINAIGVVALLALIIGNLARLLRDYRAHIPGAKLKARMVVMFVGLAVLPLVLVFWFALQFINQGIDSWFNVKVEEGLDDALALSKASLGLQMRDNLNTTMRIAEDVQDFHGRDLIYQLGVLRLESGASEITVFGRNGRIVATSSDDLAGNMPSPPGDEMMLQAQQQLPYVSLESLEQGRYEIRTAIPFGSASDPASQGVVRAVFPVNERMSHMASSVEDSYSDYKRALYLRDPLKRTITITLTIVLMISLLASVYGASSSRGASSRRSRTS